MEFLRFGSSIPGKYWGCCAVDIIQDFSVDPDDLSSIQLVEGDGGQPLVKDGEPAFAGKTYREIFNTRLRIGTFELRDMPNHSFLAIMTDGTLESDVGWKWLEILKESGFEFLRTVDNSVYTGKKIINTPGESGCSHRNYIFGLFRNIGKGAVADPYTPPKAWTDLNDLGNANTEMHSYMGEEDKKEANLRRQEFDLKVWDRIGPAKFYTEEELHKEGIPVYHAGQRSKNPPKLVEKPATPKAVADPFAHPSTK